MKQFNFLIIACVLLLLDACTNSDPSSYQKAAKETCLCVELRKGKQTDSTNASSLNLNYAECSLQSEKKYGLNALDEQFSEALKNDCPQLVNIHKRLINQSLTLNK
jgi:hypothetical protein